MADTFISYKSEDRVFAERVNDLLVSEGYSAWWDTSLITGERYADTINDELQKSKSTLVLWSKKSWVSKWVKDEALYAHHHDKLIAAKLDDVELGVPFYGVQTTDLTKWDGSKSGKEAKDIINGIERLVMKRTRRDAEINVFQVTFDDAFTDDGNISGLWDRVAALVAKVGLKFNKYHGWDFIVNPESCSPKAESFAGQINIFVLFGSIDQVGGFAADVFEPGLERFASVVNPYVVAVGQWKMRASECCAEGNLAASRVIPVDEKGFPGREGLARDVLIEHLASEIVYRVLCVKQGGQ